MKNIILIPGKTAVHPVKTQNPISCESNLYPEIIL